MSFWKDNVYEFDGEKVQLDSKETLKNFDIESHSCELYGTRFNGDNYEYRKYTMHNNGRLDISGLDMSYPICRDKDELKSFISWLIIAYKDIFDD